jgi:AbrB family looped-hinge helix DNA binding protein
MPSTVTLSTKYQVVVPKAVRERLHLRPGMKLQVIEKGGVVYLIPERPMREYRGILKGARIKDVRDESDRF